MSKLVLVPIIRKPKRSKISVLFFNPLTESLRKNFSIFLKHSHRKQTSLFN